MTRRFFTTIGLITCLALLLNVLPSGPAPTIADELEPPCRSKPLSHLHLLATDDGVCRATDGNWYMPSDATRAESLSSLVVIQETGGPDEYGYIWDQTVPLDWIDATAGTPTGLSQGSRGASVTDSIPLGFDFKFYENTYAAIHISSAGAVGFDRTSLTGRTGTGHVPSPETPNNFIAPYLAPLQMNAAGYDGQVYYLRGGSEPDRYFVAQWSEVNDDLEGSFSFQVVLRENGNILLQYLSMEHGRGWYCGTFAGIEDETGHDGLAYRQSSCNWMEEMTGRAVLFERPEPSARVSIGDPHHGRFTHPGDTTNFQIAIRNTGELGTDTYDVITSSSWPVSLFAADGITPLVDTDSDGIVDTGPVAQGDGTTIVVEVTAPDSLDVGDQNTVDVTLRSSLDTSKDRTARLTTAIPAPFAQVFKDDADGAMSLLLAQPAGHFVKRASSIGHHGSYPAVAAGPNGFAYLWSKSRSTAGFWFREIQYSLLDRSGQVQGPVDNLTYHSSPTTSVYDNDPVVSVAPNGAIGAAWYRYRYDPSDFSQNYNIFYAVLDPSGNELVPPTNLTNTDAWGGWSEIPRFYDPRIVATTDNRFVIAWTRSEDTDDGRIDDIYYAVRDTGGADVKPITKLTSDTPGWDEGYDLPTLTQLRGEQVLIAYKQRSDQDIYFTILDSDGTVTKPATNLSNDGYDSYDSAPDAAELHNGDVVVAWTGDPPKNPGETPWTGQYYNNETLTDPPALVRTDDSIDFDWGYGSPDPSINVDHFSVRWTTTITTPAGSYRFMMGSDDGSRLWIDDQLIMDHWDECCTYWYADVELEAGPHEVRMEMHEIGGAAWARLSWRQSDSGQVIRYSVIDKDDYTPKGDASALSNPAAVLDSAYVSVAADGENRAVLTWMDRESSLRSRLYYALVDSTGKTVTQPMVFLMSEASAPSILTSYSGYGNAPYIWPPEDLDLSGPTTGLIQTDYDFIATVSPTKTTPLVDYLWEASGQSPLIRTAGLTDTAAFSWSTSGTKTITVTVSNASGSVSGTHRVTVYEPVQADFTGSPASGVAPLTVEFTNTSTGDYDTCAWDFGDGVTSTLESPSHTYTAIGTYTVTLSIDGPGGIDTEIKAAYISVEPVTVYLPLVLRSH